MLIYLLTFLAIIYWTVYPVLIFLSKNLLNCLPSYWFSSLQSCDSVTPVQQLAPCGYRRPPGVNSGQVSQAEHSMTPTPSLVILSTHGKDGREVVKGEARQGRVILLGGGTRVHHRRCHGHGEACARHWPEFPDNTDEGAATSWKVNTWNTDYFSGSWGLFWNIEKRLQGAGGTRLSDYFGSSWSPPIK